MGSMSFVQPPLPGQSLPGGTGQVVLPPVELDIAPSEQVRLLYSLSDPALSELELDGFLDELLTRVQEALSVDTVAIPKVEAFYWAAITFSQTLGTALGDWMADSTGYGYGALVFAAALAAIAIAYFGTRVSHVLLFWAAFVLTRPLGASLGDFLDKPLNQGGLNLSRPLASGVIAVFIIGCLLILPQRAGQHSQPETAG